MKRTPNLTQTQKDEIIAKYLTGNYNCYQLGREYSKSGESISVMLRKNGVAILNDPANIQRKYHFNQTFFNDIKTEEQAYFLGLLLGDGYHYEKTGTVTLELQEGDNDILYKFKKYLGLEKPLVIRDRRDKLPNVQVQNILTINSRIISNDLIRLGLRQNKSFTMGFPSTDLVPEHLTRHLCRGLYDADGSFSLSINDDKVIFQSCLVVSKSCCDSLQKIFIDRLDIKSYICPPNKNKTSLIRNLNVWGIERTVKLIDWLYKDAQVYMNRKYNKYLYIKDTLSSLGLL